METKVQVTTDLVQVMDGQILTTSRQVAKVFEKQHKHVVESIKDLESRVNSTSAEKMAHQMFIKTTYTDEGGRTYTEYLMNRDGFSLLVMGFSNTEKVFHWKLKYIDTFNRMEEYIQKQTQETLEQQTALLSKDHIAQALTISGERADAAAKYLGMEIGMARIHAMNEVEDELGVSLESWKKFLPPSTEYDIPSFIPTDLAKILSEELDSRISAQKINKILDTAGYQEKPAKDWILTDRGKDYAYLIPFENKKTGHAGYQIKWKVTIIGQLKELLTK